MIARRLTVICLILSLAASAHACLWDYDTLRDERRGLPGVAEILAGRWEQHSPFFYEDRVRRMNDLIAREPNNLDAWDNLAVAYQKLGQTDKAIETILAKDKLKPGEYTTHANLGTFYLFKGRLEDAIKEIETAIQINPDAHFGREKYQLVLAKYLRDQKAGRDDLGDTFIALPNPPFYHIPATTNPAERDAWREKRRSPEAQAEMAAYSDRAKIWTANRENAIRGIVGMIRFGTDRSPDLYAALGALLESRRDAHLAYRAYLRARDIGSANTQWLSDEMEHVSAMTADKSEFGQDVVARERADAAEWVKAYQTFEDDLIRAGKDPSDESLFAPFYAKHGTAQESVSATVAERAGKITSDPTARVSIAILLAIASILLVPRAMRFTIRQLRNRYA